MIFVIFVIINAFVFVIVHCYCSLLKLYLFSSVTLRSFASFESFVPLLWFVLEEVGVLWTSSLSRTILAEVNI